MKLLHRPQRSFWHFNSVFFFIIDLLIFFGCVMAAFRLSPSNPHQWSINASESPLYLQAIFLPIFMALGLQLSNVQKLQASFRRTETVVRISFGSAVGSLLFTLLHALIHFQLVGRYIIAISWSLGVICIFLARLLLWRLARMGARAIIFWGQETSARECAETLESANLPIYIVGRYTAGELHLTQHASRPLSAPPKLDITHDQAHAKSALLYGELCFGDPQNLAPDALYEVCIEYHAESLLLSNPDEL